MRTVVLFSGGLDSTTTLAMVIARGDEVFPLTIIYGQRHAIEARAAALTLERYRLMERAKTLHLDLSFLASSALTNHALTVPDQRGAAIPSTYVPARNLLFLSLAAAYAEDIGASRIAIGVNAVDYSGYPDCRPEFVEMFNRLLAVGTKRGTEGNSIVVEAPLLRLTKGEIIKRGLALGVDYALTHSCYDPDEKGRSCGRCDSCRLRLKGFAEAGVRDPIVYVAQEKA